VKTPASAVSHWRCPFRIGFDPRTAGEEVGQDSDASSKEAPNAHAHAATRLCAIADELGHGRVVGMGGGGYNRRNIARAWTRVVQAFVEGSG